QTTNYSLYAEQIYGDRGPEGIAGYRISNQVNVKIRDIALVGDVLAAVTEAGANAIYGVNFSVADPAALEAEARAAAMDDARKRAESLAELGGVALGDIQVISEVVGTPVMPMG
ncbi:MAG TPA: SIMPL domain-containing protein, partial [Promineifilum sp.]|nr:SIMPL domain-containing protein [Promineifilum sp.]